MSSGSRFSACLPESKKRHCEPRRVRQSLRRGRPFDKEPGWPACLAVPPLAIPFTHPRLRSLTQGVEALPPSHRSNHTHDASTRHLRGPQAFLKARTRIVMRSPRNGSHYVRDGPIPAHQPSRLEMYHQSAARIHSLSSIGSSTPLQPLARSSLLAEQPSTRGRLPEMSASP